MKIKVLITGGTIDNLEYYSLEKAPKNQKSLIPLLLKQSRIIVDYGIEKILFSDSKFISDEDREYISKRCEDCKEDKIIITHGTMTMAQTAKFLGKQNIKKTIVLVGSAVPANKEKSDALFNLGLAFAAVQLLPHGVYIAMNGNIFSWNNVKKNLKTGFFEKENK